MLCRAGGDGAVAEAVRLKLHFQLPALKALAGIAVAATAGSTAAADTSEAGAAEENTASEGAAAASQEIL